jgi:hypothetical protein
MQPDNFAFGGGAAGTVIHPLILVALIITCGMILFGPRKYAPIPLLLLTFLGAIGQQINIGGLHFYVVRILIIAGIIRLIIAKFSSSDPLFAGGIDTVDKLFVLWVSFRCAAIIIRNHFDAGAITYQGSFFLDWLGGFFLFRYLIKDHEDIIRVVNVFAALTCVLTLTMLDEKFHNQNIFGYLGVVPVVPGSREGAIRAQGAFAHSILAGVFGVILMPLFWWLWRCGKAKTAGILGFLGSFSMMLMSASSTPLMAFMASVAAWFAWPFRNKLQIFRWGVVAAILALHLVMKAPVWMLISHVDVVAGNSGYHRAMLIDQCIRHFSDWWLVGTSAAGTWGWDMWDLSNQFVQEADEGGLATFICFVLIIAKTFSKIGRARKIVEGDKQQEWFMWFLGVTLVTHCMCFFGITYFDATRIVWFAFLAMVTAATAPILAAAKVEEAEAVPVLPRVKPAVASAKPPRKPEFAGTRHRNAAYFHLKQ